jgi:outer membrane protein TolC
LKNNYLPPKISLAAMLVASVFATGCAITPKPLLPHEQAELLKQDREAAQKDVDPVGETLTLNEAIARGLKYNLEHRSKMMETAIAMGIKDASRFDMLPKLVANAGYSYRDKEFLTRQTYASGPNLGLFTPGDPTISSDKTFNNSGINLTWSILDLGVSYYTAKQNADRIIVASERRRRTMHVLIQDVQSAYLRASSALKLKDNIRRVIADAEETLKNSKQVESQGLKPLLDTLRFQKSLLDNMKTLELVDQELSQARIELNQLLNLPVTTSYKMEDPDLIPVPTTFSKVNVEEFELRALLRNADLNESVYNARIALEETKKALLNYLPGLSVSVGRQHSNNSYYINQYWRDGAAQFSFNFWKLLAAPEAEQLALSERELASQKRTMMQMAVLGQVHLAKQNLQSASELYRLSANISSVDSRLAKIVIDRERQGSSSRAERVAAEASAIVSALRKYQALSQLFAASGRLQATAGLEPEIPSISEASLSQVLESVQQSTARWNSGALPPLPEPPPAPVEEAQAEAGPYTGTDPVVRARLGLPPLEEPVPAAPEPVVVEPKALAPEDVYTGTDPVVRKRLGLPPLEEPAPAAPEPVVVEPKALAPEDVYTGTDPIVRARLGLPPLPPAE